MNPKIELAEEMYIAGRPWKGGNAVLLAIIQGGKNSHTHFLRKKNFPHKSWKLCKRDLEMSLRNFDYLSGLQLYKFCPGIFFGFKK